ncbi:MAG TPA: NUDIX domain-containing protein [Opitutaceae bacterium]|nr:NUDIX domain-containing protein [Opitutaceae bacterium]
MSLKDKPTSAQNEDEVFDVVDEHDRVIGQAKRKDVHARQLLHRAIHVLVFGEDGRVFLQKRSMAKDSSPGLWDSSCSGHLDAGEDYDAAAHRELFEEIGVKLSQPPDRWFYVTARAETGGEFVWVYRTRYSGAFQLNSAEVEAGAWYEPDALTAAISESPERFTRPFRFLWSQAVARGVS